MSRWRQWLSGIGCLGGLILFFGGIASWAIGNRAGPLPTVGVLLGVVAFVSGQTLTCQGCGFRSRAIGPVMGRCPECRRPWAAVAAADDEDPGW